MLHTPAASPDAFDEFDLPEELMTPESPIFRKRPNDDTPPRGKTNQELSAEVEKLRDDLIQQNIRVEFLKKGNHELQAKWVQAKQDVEQLKPLQEENDDLFEENKKLKEKLDGLRDYEDQLDDLKTEMDMLWSENRTVKDANITLKNEVLNLSKVNDEAVVTMADQQGALDEAVEMITNLESEKLYLKEEVDDLKARVAAIESKQVGGSANHPQRVCIIDESRPVTAYDDSDYFSQPATPRAELDRDSFSVRSNRSTGTSVQSKRFIEMSKERTQSTHNLSKRMSEASLRAASLVFSTQPPEVPQIPKEFTPQAVDKHFRQRRYLQELGVEHHIAIAGSQLRRPATAAPQVQTHQPSGLRSLHRPDQLQRSSTQRPSSSHTPSSSQSTKTRPRYYSVVDVSPEPPPRMSSRHAHTISDDRLRPQLSDGTIESTTTTSALVGSEQEQVLINWISSAPRSSMISILTEPAIDRLDRERWWKDTENVKPLKTRATMRELREDFSDDGNSKTSFAARVDGMKSSSTTPAVEKTEKDFLFNPSENEEQFMKKTMTKLKGSIRRRYTELD
jgi:hypothetical protein